MSAGKVTPRAIDPDFARSIADGLTESVEAYCKRLDATIAQPAADPPAEEAAT
ncbi:hypothetical protein [Streptomyces bugieae]|uniref:Uncharacterized protein n=1 Tax=Streptomyces bugieae TaxID=3098223 RepID=A0ABU7NL50_9ACTN|nr:hypothetical protein [Streptomyces sp. DSM 41528]